MNAVYPEISSTRNPLAQRIKALHRSKGRREEGLFLAEGRKLVEEAWRAGLTPALIFCGSRALEQGSPESTLLAELPQENIHLVTEDVLQAVSDARSPQPVLAAFPLPERPPLGTQSGFCLMLDGLQDPGNMGSMMRSGDALGADWLLLGPGCADPYAPKTLRAAMGSTFHLPMVQAEDLLSAAEDLIDGGYVLVAGDLAGASELPGQLPESTALVIGNEGNGISPALLARCQIRYRLPMKGRAESLNAGAAAAILLYEISRRLPE